MATKYKKINDNEFEITETKEEVSVVKLDFVEADIAHKDKLINELKNGIINIVKDKADLEIIRQEILKVK